MANPIMIFGDEEVVANLLMYRPSIATDSQCQPHIVCDAGGNTRFMKFHRLAGKWSGGIFATGSRSGKYSASRLYIGQIEIDAQDRAWISCKFGCAEFGTMLGQGLWLYKNVTAAPKMKWFRHVAVHKGMGLVSLDPAFPSQGVVLGTLGNFAVLDAKGQTIRKDSMDAGTGGEKVRFRISRGGTWHTCMVGWQPYAAAYHNDKRWAAGLKPITWMSYSRWPQQGNDLIHPGLGVDLVNPDVCYMAVVIGKQLLYNVYDGARLMFGDNPMLLDQAAVYEQRHGPAFAPCTKGGTFIFYPSYSGSIEVAHIRQNGNAVGYSHLIGNGASSPAACTDHQGNVHLVYRVGSTIRYRKVTVQA